MITISKVLISVNNDEDFWIAFGDFLDEFYRQSDQIRQQMIIQEPIDCLNANKAHKALFAATVHKLANDYMLKIPDWVWKKDYYMKEHPFFDCNAKGNLRLLFMYKSPTEFKHRNLFVDENILVRV